MRLLQNELAGRQGVGGVGQDTVIKTSPLHWNLSAQVCHCLPPGVRNYGSSVPEFGEKERNYLFKSYTGFE